jgi:hypothetical protein
VRIGKKLLAKVAVVCGPAGGRALAQLALRWVLDHGRGRNALAERVVIPP